MSKITFRADDDLIDRLEEFEASKSEVMREALRAYLDGEQSSSVSESSTSESVTDTESIDELIAERVDSIIDDRLGHRSPRREPQDVNVNISLDADSGAVTEERADDGAVSDTASDAETADVSHGGESRKTGADHPEPQTTGSCAQCGEELASSHVYCPNCGEKASRRVFCDCGDELRSDWGFCPGCGRRTPAADVLDQHRSGANRE